MATRKRDNNRPTKRQRRTVQGLVAGGAIAGGFGANALNNLESRLKAQRLFRGAVAARKTARRISGRELQTLMATTAKQYRAKRLGAIVTGGLVGTLAGARVAQAYMESSQRRRAAERRRAQRRGKTAVGGAAAG